jgi:FtsH-binding integral membrane protein
MPTTIDPHDSALRRFASEVAARAAAVVGLAGIGVIHLIDSIGKFQETPYMGWMYIGLILGCLGAGFALLRANIREAWLAAIVLPASAIVGYVLTRTTGLPQAHEDVGNWTEPLGLAALFTEGVVIAISAYALSALQPVSAFARRAWRGDLVSA